MNRQSFKKYLSSNDILFESNVKTNFIKQLFDSDNKEGVAMYLTLTDIDEVNCSFSIKGWINFIYVNNNSSSITEDINDVNWLIKGSEKVKIQADERITFDNEFKLENITNLVDKTMPQYNGYIIRNISFEMTIPSTFNYKNFPMDFQVFSIELFPFSKLGKDLLLSVFKGNLISPKVSNSWSVIGVSDYVKQTNLNYDDIYDDLTRLYGYNNVEKKINGLTTCGFNIILRRKPTYLITNVFIPIFLAGLFSFTSYFMKSEEFTSKCGVLLTLFLTMSAMRFVINSMLPISDNFTLVDKYIILNYLLIFISLILFSVNNLKGVNGLESIIGAVLFLIWMSFNLLFWINLKGSDERDSVGKSMNVQNSDETIIEN